jgi:hypothetical protein
MDMSNEPGANRQVFRQVPAPLPAFRMPREKENDHDDGRLAQARHRCCLGSAVKVGDVRGIFAVLIVFASFWRKLRMEERMLGETFGDRYAAYKRRTKALLPGIL